jgi:hypothetical protein
MEASDALKEGVLTAMRLRLRQSSDKLIEQFQVMEVELNKASSTWEEVLALKKYIQRSQAQQEKMKEDLLHNKLTIDFLVKHLMPISQEVRHRFHMHCSLPVCFEMSNTECPSYSVLSSSACFTVDGDWGCNVREYNSLYVL